jgi:urocanate hydratase
MASYRAPRGAQLTCANWQIEAAYRMIQNNLDRDVAEDPERLIVYGGLGKAARNPEALAGILATLRRLQPTQTMLVQSGKCVGVFDTHADAPRVLLANSNLVGDWANWDEFRRLDQLGLIMYGQMTAGSWIYIGSQGIVQGTYETFVAAGQKHFGSDLRGRLVVTAGLGGMGGAQPLAVTMAGGVCLAADVEGWRIDKRLETRYLDERIDDPKVALQVALQKKAAGVPWSIGVACNATELLAVVRDAGVVPDLLTDQTSAHDMLVGYVPDGMTVAQAKELRERDPKAYLVESRRTVAQHVALMLDLQERGAITFDYGNNIRTEARDAGVAEGIRPTSPAPTSWRWRCSATTPRCAPGWRRRSRRSPSRACRRASCGWATASGPGLRWPSTTWSPAANCRRRWCSAATTWTAVRWPRRTARPRRCSTAAMRSPTGRCSTRC